MPRFVRLLPVLLVLLAACMPDTAPPAEVALVPARLLDPWQPVTDTLAAGAFHEWRFVANPGDAVHLLLRNHSADVALALLGADGAVIGGGSDLRVTLTTGGTYTVVVRLPQGEPSVYTLSLEYTDRLNPADATATPTLPLTPTITLTPSVTPTEPPTLTPTPPYADLGVFRGALVDGVSNSGEWAGEPHIYTFRAAAGQFASLRMVRVDGAFDPEVWLYDPAGAPLGMDDNTGGERDALLQNIRLPLDGEYSVRALGGDRTGGYRLLLTLGSARVPVTPQIPAPTQAPPPTPTPAPRRDRLVDHVPVAGQIARPGDFARYPIVVVQGEVFTVGVSPVAGSALLPDLELYTPSGERAAAATASTSNADGDALIAGYRAAESGVYFALVTGERDTTGSFVISYGLGGSRETVTRGTARADVENRAELARRGLRDSWTVTLNAGDVISASVRPESSGFDPELDLVAPDGAVLAFDADSGGAALPLISSVRAPISGVYALRVSATNAGSRGSYALVWRYVSAAPTPTPPAATVRLLSADAPMPAQTYLFFPFQGQATQRILIRTQAQSGNLDLVLALLDADGTILAEADDNSTDLNPALLFELPADGSYTLRLNGYGQTTGDFEVIIEALY